MVGSSACGLAAQKRIGKQRPEPAALRRITDRFTMIDRRLTNRLPAVTVTICFAIGILLDRRIDASETVWLLGGFALLGGSLFWARRFRAAPGWMLLLACLFAGGARHHQVWSLEADNDISLFTTQGRQPVRLIGTLSTPPQIRDARVDSFTPFWARHDHTDCLVRPRFLVSGDERIAVSGLARLSVTGRLEKFARGDTVMICGWISRPYGPANPGAFDARADLRRSGVRTVIRVGAPAAIERISPSRAVSIANGSSRLRAHCDAVLKHNLSSRTYPVATALLLGIRSHLPDDMRTAFAQSGTVHLLAISGLHVGILAGFFWLGCRLLNLASSTTALIVIAGVCGYALLTDGRPSVVRATVFVVITGFGYVFSRRTRPANAVALSALVLLVWDPTNLFNVGAQLSFLAILGLLGAAFAFEQRTLTETVSAGEALALDSLRRQSSRSRRILASALRRLKQGILLSAVVWLLTAPLVAARFHLVSPVGLLLNVVLIPLVVGVLGMGYALLLFGVLLPWVAAPFGFGFDAGLALLLWVVETASDLHVSSLYLPGPSNWWLIGYYGLLAAIVLSRSRPNGRRLGIMGLCLWTVFGLAVPLMPSGPRGLRCTFLSVGHGCAVLIEMPHGRTLLYDAGSILTGRIAQRAVQSTLWIRGRSRIDAVVISHADSDHFNGLPALMNTMPIGSLLVSSSFRDSAQRRARDLCAAATARHIPVQMVRQGDRLLIDDDVTIRVLHPDPRHLADSDNANSVVLLIEFAGRRILLTGDLENEGLSQLLSQPPQPVDILLAPHHGSRRANTGVLANWARPNWVIVSGNRLRRPKEIRSVYGDDAQIITTGNSGAVTMTILPDGSLQSQTYRNQTGF